MNRKKRMERLELELKMHMCNLQRQIKTLESLERVHAMQIKKLEDIVLSGKSTATGITGSDRNAMQESVDYSQMIIKMATMGKM